MIHVATQAEAYRILDEEVRAYRELPFADLEELVGETNVHRVVGRDNRCYAVEVTIRRNTRNPDTLALNITIDDEASWMTHRVERTIALTPDP